jgi:serine/threonine protein kinase
VFARNRPGRGGLNHPNIVAVYDVGIERGSSYIVTEILEGETLDQRIQGRPLPVRKAIDYALQIANGMAAAHERGVVHRDIKPANVFVTNDGRIKISTSALRSPSVRNRPRPKRSPSTIRSTPSSAPCPTRVTTATEFLWALAPSAQFNRVSGKWHMLSIGPARRTPWRLNVTFACFKNGRNQALRIPRDLELPGREAILRKEGSRFVRTNWRSFLFEVVID